MLLGRLRRADRRGEVRRRRGGQSLVKGRFARSCAMEPNSPKKIQFAVPLFQSQLDPQASEQIRKRRPTPATLVIIDDQAPPESAEKRTNNSQGEMQSAEMSPKQRKQSVFTPPALKGVKLMKMQNESAFLEEEEAVDKPDKDWSQ
ncbi:protein phosphatase 1 regulatory subunit 1C [Polypterus senegalus]|uniref:protein phosphatase 1 regulatory subunit 1C n=1 Tax=Polypterus senegalus TaxID=55291 RepID=UPI001964A7BC|nr:protein phosphatase 1 regulatory subunit 1C [Polypterus senegalus]